MADLASARLLVFRVADVLCGVEVTTVREVLPRQQATRIPGAPPAVLGLITVRGNLVPLVDGRRALGAPDDALRGAILLFDVGGRPIGLTVDDVVDLFAVSAEDLVDRAALPGVDRRLVRAVGRRGVEAFVLLDLAALFAPLFTLEGSRA